MAHKNPKIEDFINKYIRFMEEVGIMSEKRNAFKGATDSSYEMNVWRFRKTAEFFVDRAWSALSVPEKAEADEFIRANMLGGQNDRDMATKVEG